MPQLLISVDLCTGWHHLLQSGLASSPRSLSSHSCTFRVHVVLTSAQQMQLMWQPDACGTTNALKSNCALAPSLFLCYAESNKMPKPKLILIQFISFYGVGGTSGDSTGVWSIWEGVPQWQFSPASAWFWHNHLPPVHRTEGDSLTIKLTTCNWGCFSPSGTTLFTLPILKEVQRGKSQLTSSRAR